MEKCWLVRYKFTGYKDVQIAANDVHPGYELGVRSVSVRKYY